MTFTARPAAAAPGPWRDNRRSRRHCAREIRKDFALATGKAYRLKVKSTGAKECAWQAPQFVNFVWLRKIEVSKGEIKASHVYETESGGRGGNLLHPDHAWRVCLELPRPREQRHGGSGRFDEWLAARNGEPIECAAATA